MTDNFIGAVLTAVAVLLFVFLVAVLTVSFYKHMTGQDTRSKYRELCRQADGKPVWNGRNWECWK